MQCTSTNCNVLKRAVYILFNTNKDCTDVFKSSKDSLIMASLYLEGFIIKVNSYDVITYIPTIIS